MPRAQLTRTRRTPFASTHEDMERLPELWPSTHHHQAANPACQLSRDSIAPPENPASTVI
jgi:hypothetical protein